MKKLIKYKLVLVVFFVSTYLSENCFSNQEVNIIFKSDTISQEPYLLGYYYGNDILFRDTLRFDKCNSLHFQSDDSKVYCLIQNENVKIALYIPYYSDDTVHITLQEQDETIFIAEAPKKTLLYESIKRKKNLSTPQNGNEPENLSPLDATLFDVKQLYNPPEEPAVGLISNDSIPSLEQLQYQLKLRQKNYLNNVNFSNPQLINFPEFTDKIHFFLDHICPQTPEALVQFSEDILKKSTANTTMYSFMLPFLLNKYEKNVLEPEYEFVFATLLEKHVLTTNKAIFSDSKVRDYQVKYNRIKPVLLKNSAPDFILVDRKQKPVNLYSVKGEKIILFFYDYDCSTCREAKSELIKINLQLKKENITVLSICLSESYRKWRKEIKSENLTNWVYGFNSNPKQHLASTYQITYLPCFYLLNSEKTIEMKKFHLNELMKFLQNNSVKNKFKAL